MWVARWAFTVTLAALVCTRAASAGTSTDVYVHVSHDAHRLGGAVCRLRSVLQHVQRIVDRDGTAKFQNVVAGKYSVECELSGFDVARSDVFVHEDDVELHVEVRLHLHEIGRVSAREPAATTTRILTRGSPLGKLSQNLYDLMNSVGGANILTDASGSLVGISLEGRDPRLTQYSFDGSRIPEPGALRALDADLLQSSRLDDGKSEVDFYTLAPTTFPEYTLRQAVGGFGSGATQLSVRGSVGSVGYVLQGKVRTQDSALNNATYVDTSGLRYKHIGALHGDGLLAKLSAPVSKTFTLTAETLLRGSTTLPIDTFFAGPLPSGAGPGNVLTSLSAFTKAELEGDIGRWHASFNATTIRTSEDFDYRNRIVALQALPFRSSGRFRLDILDTSLIDFITEGKTLNLSLSMSRGTSTLNNTSLAFGGAYASQQVVYRPDERFRMVYVERPSSSAQQSLGLTVESRGAGRTSAFVEANASFGSTRGRVFGTAGFGGHVASPSELQTFDDPAAAQYDCDGGAIRARAPNDSATNVPERHVRVGGLLQGARGSLSIQAYDTLDSGLTVSNANTPLSAFPSSLLPGDYIKQLLQGYGSYGQCPTPRAAPAIYLLRDVSGLTVEYRGIEIATSLTPSKSLTLQASLNAHLATLRSRVDALLAPDSPYIIGKQLPAVEPLDASLTADYGFHDRRTELIANAVYKSRNNGNGPPAYWLLTIGGTRKLSSTSSITLVATNALRSHVGLFSSSQYAVPLPTVSGGQLLLPAAPLTQPQIFAVFNVRIAHEP
jgi:hypothetical protein